MSRTKEQNPAPGKEYWTARPGNKHGQPLGKFSKTKTHRAERRIGKFISAIEKAHSDAEHSTLRFGPAATGGEERRRLDERLKGRKKPTTPCVESEFMPYADAAFGGEEEK